MHEYSVASGMVEAILRKLKELKEVGKVKEVHLLKGELLHLSEPALIQAYEILTEGTPLEGSRLMIKEIKTQVECECGYSGRVKYYDFGPGIDLMPLLECPICGSPAKIKCGRELELIKLVIEEKVLSDTK
jgi:hydrogenase nickel insertion protein HypA